MELKKIVQIEIIPDLLSEDEFKEYNGIIPEILDLGYNPPNTLHYDWWLRPSIKDGNYNLFNDMIVPCVMMENIGPQVIKNSSALSYCRVNSSMSVRPVIRISNPIFKINSGDTIEFGDYPFTVLSPNLLICNKFICISPFSVKKDNDSSFKRNCYESSDVKRVIDDWFQKQNIPYVLV